VTNSNAPSTEEREVAFDHLGQVKARGIQWLMAHIDESGRPADSQQRKGWYRLPWAHVGLRGEAGTILSWAGREALTARVRSSRRRSARSVCREVQMGAMDEAGGLDRCTSHSE
jgi:hypothetical protein